MSHPYFDAPSFPWHRDDAAALLRALTNGISDQRDIEFHYRRSGPGLSVFSHGNAQHMWTEALANMQRARTLESFCRLLLAESSYASMHPAIRSVVTATGTIGHAASEQPGEEASSFPLPPQGGDNDSDGATANDLKTLDPGPGNWGKVNPVGQVRKIGRYNIVAELGRGGQGLVYRAVHPDLAKEVAIKISVRALDAEGRQAFRDEAQILCDLEHDNIARVRDLDFDGGRPFLVLDLIRGRSLHEQLKTSVISRKQTIHWLMRVARAIDFAHRRGVLHLDLKPGNIVINEHDEPQVIDFGLARMRDMWSDSANEKDQVSGTLEYMSPEQAEGKASGMGAHSDVFALGAVLYHLLTGKPPFAGSNRGEILQAVRNCRFNRQALDQPGVDRRLKSVCLKAMAAQPSERFASAAQFADAIGNRFSFLPWRLATWQRSGLVMVVGVLLLVGGTWLWQQDRQAGAVASSDAMVEEFAITHIGNDGGQAAFSVPLFGGAAPREEDDIRVSARFAYPLYCFLFACNPDGTFQLCYPDRESQEQSEPVLELFYPSDDSLAFGLTDGVGSQAFILVTSPRPLPTFQEWLADSSEVGWPDQMVSGNWKYVGGSLQPVGSLGAPGETVGSRGTVRTWQRPTKLASYLDTLRQPGKVDVQCVVFDVVKRE